MIYTDLLEIKKVLEIDPDNTAEDFKFQLFNEWAGGIMETVLGQDFTYKSRTQYYKGSGTRKLLLRNRPVYPSPPSPFSSITVTIDENGYFGQGPGAFTAGSPTAILNWELGTDYMLQVDQDDGSSRCGILIATNRYWPKPSVRQKGLLSPFIDDDTGSIQVVYTAGFTVDTLPAIFRMCAAQLMTELRYLFPLGQPLNSENYKDRSIGIMASEQERLTKVAKPFLLPWRNWRFA